MDLARYISLFVSDGRENLRRAGELLLEWEQRPADPAPVDELFRAFHSLKGAAATMEYAQVVELAHRSEHVLDAVRQRRQAGTTAMIGLLLRAVDVLERGLEGATRGEPIPEAAEVAAELARFDDGAPRPVEAPRLSAAFAIPVTSERPAMRAVRIDPARLDELLALASELVVARNRLAIVASGRADGELESAAGRIDSLARALHGGVLRARLAPVTELFGRFPRVVRDLSQSLGRPALLELEGEGIELDRTVLEGLVDPLIHLLRNAVDHGIEPVAERLALGKPAEGRLRLGAERRRDWIVIRLVDDGRGIDREAVAARAAELGIREPSPEPPGDDEVLDILARPGFTLRREVTAISGRGVGMDAVASRVRSLGGRLRFETRRGVGTTFEITVPLTTAVQRVLVVAVGGDRYAIPFRIVREAMMARSAGPGDRLTFRGRDLPLVDLGSAVGTMSARAASAKRPVLVFEWGEQDGALAVDRLLGQHDVLLETLEAPRGTPAWVSGATILADGAPAFVLDPTALF